MELKAPLLKILNRVYEPLAVISLTFKRYDLVLKTDDEGRPILLFMGKVQANGMIRGERYARRFKKNDHGEIIKDHWEHKGRAT